MRLGLGITGVTTVDGVSREVRSFQEHRHFCLCAQRSCTPLSSSKVSVSISWRSGLQTAARTGQRPLFLLNKTNSLCPNATAAARDYAWSVPKLEFGNRKGKSKKCPFARRRMAPEYKTVSCYWPTIVAPRKLNT